jgi:hypothetical protein
MTAPTPTLRHAFRDLERALLRRGLARIEPILWLEIVALGALGAAFVFWQVHLRLASIAHDRGAHAAVQDLGVLLALLALAGASQVGARHLVRLRSSASGPAWLTLPIPELALERHLATVSRVQSAWLIAPATGLLIAAAGVIPAWWLPLLALAFVAALDGAGRLACSLALRLAAGPAGASARPAIVRALTHVRRAARARVRPASAWGRSRGAWALMSNDARLSRRLPVARRRALLAALALALAFAAWRMPIEPRATQFIAFGLSLFAAAALAEWLIALIGADPADVLRALPIGVAGTWGARMRWALLATAILVVGHLLTSRGLEPGPFRFFLASVGLSALAILTLGVNYGVSLYPRAELAQRMLALTLALAIAASLMVPLMGWIVLLTAVLHSSRRVARWSRAEER